MVAIQEKSRRQLSCLAVSKPHCRFRRKSIPHAHLFKIGFAAILHPIHPAFQQFVTDVKQDKDGGHQPGLSKLADDSGAESSSAVCCAESLWLSGQGSLFSPPPRRREG
jgi:hypothetical protein